MSALALRGGAPVRTRPFASWPVHDTREETSLLEVLHSGHWNRWEGERVQDFESRFAAYLEISHALAVSSGTAALECAVHAAGVGPGDEVILPAYGYTMPACAVLRVGGVPVFADVDAETFNL
ncbi:MAG: DegT/DnrJ/EryC1/StrS family aminotransferase, partial [Armatimonadetes bacterium]|nr:DegT/DnrJ/EryC1/StrS family aminotransferase [Armatimonadota bacterium]